MTLHRFLPLCLERFHFRAGAVITSIIPRCFFRIERCFIAHRGIGRNPIRLHDQFSLMNITLSIDPIGLALHTFIRILDYLCAIKLLIDDDRVHGGSPAIFEEPRIFNYLTI